MTFAQYWAIVVKQWRLIVVCCLLAGLGACFGSKFLVTPLYQSSALVQVVVRTGTGDSQVDYNNLLASEQLTQTEAQLTTSDSVLREVASHYPGVAVDQLTKAVTAAPKLNTQLFEIDVQYSNPAKAAVLANDVAGTLIKQQTQVVQQGDFLRVAQIAQPNPTPIRPNILLNTLAGLATGLFLGLVLAVLFELLDKHVRTPEALSQLLDWPVLATIWFARSSRKRKGVSSKGVSSKERDINTESYRMLRTNIGFSTLDKPLHSLMITSALPLEGKSEIAANLAVFMAKAGKTTLLIDANLRNPTLHKLFDLSADALGLSDAVLAFNTLTTTSPLPQDRLLSSGASVQASAPRIPIAPSLEPYLHSVGVANLWVVPSGSPVLDPSEMLDSTAMQRFFTAITRYGFELSIIDTSPLLGVADASILASKIDGTLVVVDITRAHQGNLKQMKALLSQAGARVLGCVVNKQRHTGKDVTYSYFHNEEQYNKWRSSPANQHDTENRGSRTIEMNSALENGSGRSEDTIRIDRALVERAQIERARAKKRSQHENSR